METIQSAPAPPPRKDAEADGVAAEEQDRSPERTTPEGPETVRPAQRPSVPTGPMSFKEELERKLGLGSRQVAQEPACKTIEAAEHPVSLEGTEEPKSVDTQLTTVASTSVPNGSAVAGGVSRSGPPLPRKPPAQKQTKPPTVPSLPPRKNSSESVTTVASVAKLVAEQRPTAAVPRSGSPCNSEVSTPRSPSGHDSRSTVTPSNDISVTSSSEVSRVAHGSTGPASASVSVSEEQVPPPGPATRSRVNGGSHPEQRFGFVHSTWNHKNLETELNVTRGELLEERARASTLEEQVRNLQNHNLWLQKQLDIQADSQELLRDIRDRVSEVEIFREPPRQRKGLCGAVCSIFGRN